MEKPLTQAEAERKLKAQLMLLELQSQEFDKKMNKIRSEIHGLEKENKKILKNYKINFYSNNKNKSNN